MNRFENYAYRSRFRNIDPSQKLFLATLTLIVVIICYSPLISVVVATMMSYITLVVAKVSWRDYLYVFSVPLSFILLSGITLALEVTTAPVSGAVHFLYWYFSVSQSGLLISIIAMTTALGAISVLYTLVFTTPLIDILYALKKWHCPTILITLMMMTYKFVFILIRMSSQMYLAQKSRLGYKTLRSSYLSVGQIVATLFIRAIKKTNRIVDALEARGYHGDIVVLDRAYRQSAFFWVLGLLFNAFLLALCWLYR